MKSTRREAANLCLAFRMRKGRRSGKDGSVLWRDLRVGRKALMSRKLSTYINETSVLNYLYRKGRRKTPATFCCIYCTLFIYQLSGSSAWGRCLSNKSFTSIATLRPNLNIRLIVSAHQLLGCIYALLPSSRLPVRGGETDKILNVAGQDLHHI